VFPSRAGDRIRTGDVQLGNAASANSTHNQDNELQRQAPALAVRLRTVAETDTDLARLIEAWPALPPHIRAAVLALVGAAS
jgi:hypothetical protein